MEKPFASQEPVEIEEQDVMKVLAAIQTGKRMKQKFTVTIVGVENGGIIGINLETEKKFK